MRPVATTFALLIVAVACGHGANGGEGDGSNESSPDAPGDSPDAGADASAEAGPCGARDEAGVAHTGSCPPTQYCCDQSHTGGTEFICHELDAGCYPVP